MDGVDKFVGHIEHDWQRRYAHQIAAPPIRLAAELLHAFDDDEPVWIRGEDGIAAAIRGFVPVRQSAVRAPVGGRFGFIEKDPRR